MMLWGCKRCLHILLTGLFVLAAVGKTYAQDACQPINPCENKGECTNTDDGFSCNCDRTPYSGDLCEVDPVPCPPGHEMNYLRHVDDPYFKFNLKFNRKNQSEAGFFLGINGSNNFISLRGRDSYVIESKDGSYFYLRKTCVETKQVRNVVFTVFEPESQKTVEKKVKMVKGSFTDACMDKIGPEGIYAGKILYQFRTTKGKKNDFGKQNDFDVKGLAVIACTPV